MSTGLNTAIVSALTSLSPWVSESIIKIVGGDNRLMMPIGMVLNAIINTIELDNKTIMCIFCFLLFLISLYYVDCKYSIITNMCGKITIRTPSTPLPVLTLNAQIVPKSTGSTQIDQFFVAHPEYLDIVTFSAESWVGSLGRTETAPSLMSLTNGKYRAVMSQSLDIAFVVSGAGADRKIDITFHKGTEADLLKFMNDTVIADRIKKYVAPINVTPIEKTIYYTSYYVCSIYCPPEKNDKTIFKNYYHPELPNLIKQIDLLDRPISDNNYQPQQFSCIFYGPAGTGKTTIVRLLAQYKHLNIVSIQLHELKSIKDLESTFWNGEYRGRLFDISNTIFELDELDKSIGHMANVFKRDQERTQPQCTTTAGTGDAATTTTIPTDSWHKPDYTWNFNDLLRILCGANIPHGRKIMATANSIDLITKHCPYLIRPGRMTPIQFTHGTAQNLVDMVQNSIGQDIDINNVPADYRFIQAGLTDYLNSGNRTAQEVINNLDRFRVDLPIDNSSPTSLDLRIISPVATVNSPTSSDGWTAT